MIEENKMLRDLAQRAQPRLAQSLLSTSVLSSDPYFISRSQQLNPIRTSFNFPITKKSSINLTRSPTYSSISSSINLFPNNEENPIKNIEQTFDLNDLKTKKYEKQESPEDSDSDSLVEYSSPREEKSYKANDWLKNFAAEAEKILSPAHFSKIPSTVPEKLKYNPSKESDGK